jgi:phosphohistidine phosphatase
MRSPGEPGPGGPLSASQVQTRERASSSSSQVIYLLRHGPAGQRSKWHGNDADRPLSERGRVQVRRVSRVLWRAGIQTELIVTSPFARATETAEIVSDVFELDQPPTIEPLLQPGIKPDRLHVVLRTHIDIGSILIVGHEPSLSHLISYLCASRQPPLKKAGLAEVTIDREEPPRGRLTWLAEPKDLFELAHGQLPDRQR